MNKLKFIASTLFVLSITYIFARGCIQQSRLNNSGKFTIAHTVGSEFASRGPLIKIKFIVKGIEYSGKKRSLKYNPIIYDGRYFIKYLPSDPEINDIYWDKPVPDSLQFAPDEGWKSIP